jgi:hypothetical protein
MDNINLKAFLKGTKTRDAAIEKLTTLLTLEERNYVSVELKKIEDYFDDSYDYDDYLSHGSYESKIKSNDLNLSKIIKEWDKHPNIKVRAILALNSKIQVVTLSSEIVFDLPVKSDYYNKMLLQILIQEPSLLTEQARIRTMTEGVVNSIWNALNNFLLGNDLDAATQNPAIVATISFMGNLEVEALKKLQFLVEIIRNNTIVDPKAEELLLEEQDRLIKEIKKSFNLENVPDSWIKQIAEENTNILTGGE